MALRRDGELARSPGVVNETRQRESQVAAESRAIRGVCGGAGGLSFSADTLVATPSGERAIGSLKVGDQVTAYDPSTGKSSTQTVQHVWINHDHDLLDVTLRRDGQDGHATAASSSDKTQQVAIKAHGSQAPPSPSPHDTSNETIHTTENHPWLTTDRGWVQAGNLRLGEHVVALDGHTATITALAAHPGAATYYNLTVSTLHTYAVGKSHAVVHNDGCEDLIATAEQAGTNANAPSATSMRVEDALGNLVELPLTTFTSERAVIEGPFQDIIQEELAKGLKYAGGCGERFACGALYEQGNEVKGGYVEMGLWHENGEGPCSACRRILQRTANELHLIIHLEAAEQTKPFDYFEELPGW